MASQGASPGRTRTPKANSALLINEPPLLVLPSLAVLLGLNEAIILQQMHFWLQRSTHSYDGLPWVYNTYEDWRAQFPFWSLDTIKRAILRLETLGVLHATSRFNRNPIDKSKWYTIDPTWLNALTMPTTMQNAPSTMQNAPSTMHGAPLDEASCPLDEAFCPASQRDPTETPAENPSPQTPPPPGEGPDAVASNPKSADAPAVDQGWHTCPVDFFPQVQQVIAHPPGRGREHDPPAAPPAGGPAP